MRGDTPRFVVKVKNAGDAPLEIEAKPHCGCTVAKFDRTIAPGGQGQIEAEVHTAGFHGAVSKALEVDSNDLTQPQLMLRLSVKVQAAVEVTPGESTFIPLEADEPTVRQF